METKGSSLAEDSESGGLKTKKAFQESGTSLKSLNPAYKAKCDSFFIICGKPEFFKGVAQKKHTEPAQFFIKVKKMKIIFTLKKCGIKHRRHLWRKNNEKFYRAFKQRERYSPQKSS